MDPALAPQVDALIATAAAAHARGQLPATSGNLSVRVGRELLLVTASGRDKGRLVPDDLLLLTTGGEVLGTATGGAPERPSAETPLHLALYRRFPAAGAVVHVHGPAATTLSRRAAGSVRLRDYELLKALAGIATHEVVVDVPVLPNRQDVDALAGELPGALVEDGPPAFLLRAHGLYAWGATLADAARHAEALEALFHCELLGRAAFGATA